MSPYSTISALTLLTTFTISISIKCPSQGTNYVVDTACYESRNNYRVIVSQHDDYAEGPWSWSYECPENITETPEMAGKVWQRIYQNLDCSGDPAEENRKDCSNNNGYTCYCDSDDTPSQRESCLDNQLDVTTIDCFDPTSFRKKTYNTNVCILRSLQYGQTEATTSEQYLCLDTNRYAVATYDNLNCSGTPFLTDMTETSGCYGTEDACGGPTGELGRVCRVHYLVECKGPIYPTPEPTPSPVYPTASPSIWTSPTAPTQDTGPDDSASSNIWRIICIIISFQAFVYQI